MRTSFTFRPRIRYGNKYSTFTKSYPALQRKCIITNIRQRCRYSLSLIFLNTGLLKTSKTLQDNFYKTGLTKGWIRELGKTNRAS